MTLGASRGAPPPGVSAGRSPPHRETAPTPATVPCAARASPAAPVVAAPAMAELYELVGRLALTNLPVLIVGETGSGKELVATALHERSPRAGRPMVSVNCAALHEGLVESTLFGHEKGAFSGAVAAQPGLIETASGATLFLDEVGELPLRQQAKLLRVLECQRLTPLGGVHEREVDVRVVSATNRDPDAEIRAGRFRQDLYFRLSAAMLRVPPLRHRIVELPLLAAVFLDDACLRSGRPPMRISAAAMALLEAHRWPGNVRELRNLLEYLVATLPGDVLEVEHVRPRVTPSLEPSDDDPAAAPPRAASFRPLVDEIRELELARIGAALAATGGNQTRAAALLAMPLRTFCHKAKHYGLTSKRQPGRSQTSGVDDKDTTEPR